MTAALIAHLWQSTLFACAAALLTLAFRRNRAKVRYALWLSASLKFFIPFALLMNFGSRLDWAPAAQKIAAPEIAFAAQSIAQPFAEPLRFAPHPGASVNWAPIALAGLWACGFLAITLMRLNAWRCVRAAVRMSAPVQIPAPIQIRSAPGLLEPGVVGVLRPVLLLPEGIVDRLTPSQLEAVLAHELCHVRRRDNLFASIHMMVEVLFWFHPVVWFIGARLVEERERACDESVLSMGSEPRIYADAILSVCKLYVESPLACVSGVTGANLRRRIEAIMSDRTEQGLNRAKKCLLAAAGIAALGGPIAVGLLIGVGDIPAIHAQVSGLIAPLEQPAQLASAPPPAMPQPSAAPPQSAAPAADAPFQNHRLLAMLLDLDTMSSDDLSRARQSALDFVHNKSAPDDLVALITVSGGQVKVVQDFTADRALLESMLLKSGGGEGNGAAGGAGHTLATIETTAHILGSLPGRKALIYFASGTQPSGADHKEDLRRAIDAAIKSNIAIYTIDVRGLIPQIMPQVPAAAPAASEPAPGTPQEEHNRRAEEAPDVIQGDLKIDWPPPLARYWSDRSADAALPGLLSGHFFVQVHAAGEYQTISVPMAMSGRFRFPVKSSRPRTPPRLAPRLRASFGL